jgi:DNA-directed RNA polymerase specialized sigma24 family protein
VRVVVVLVRAWLSTGPWLCDRYIVHGRLVASSTELRGFLRDAVGEVYRYALALTGSPARAEQLTTSAAVRLARHVDAVGAAPVSETRLALAVRRAVLDSRPRHRHRLMHRHDEARPESGETSPSAALAALDLLTPDERLAFVLRHHDGLLLPDVGAALGRSREETEALLARAREIVGPAMERYEDGSAGDPCARLLRAVPGPPEAFAERVWANVDSALVPEYAGGGGVSAVTDDVAGSLAWVGSFEEPIVREERSPVREARHTGMTLLAGVVVLAVILGLATLTAPRKRGDAGAGVTAATTTPETSLPVSSVPNTTLPGRAGGPPAVPDLVVDAATVAPHPPDVQGGLLGPGGSAPFLRDTLPTVAIRVRTMNDVSSVVVRRSVPTGGSDVWLVSVKGIVRATPGAAPSVIDAWGVDEGAVVIAMRVEGHPDAVVLVGLRQGGGGTWLRLPDAATPLMARPDGSVLCIVPGETGPSLGTYQVLR